MEFTLESGFLESGPFDVLYPVVKNQASVESGTSETIFRNHGDVLRYPQGAAHVFHE